MTASGVLPTVGEAVALSGGQAPGSGSGGRGLRSVSVVIPVYNSERSLPGLVERLAPVLSQCASDYEILLVNDCSRDRSWQVVQDLAARSANVRGINLMRNYGQQNALLAGIRAASHEVVVTMDDDLQHPPEEVPKLLAHLTDEYDVVYGTFQQGQHGLFRDFSAWLTRAILGAVMGVGNAHNVSAFRAFRTELRQAFVKYESPFVALDVLLTWGTTRFGACLVEHHPRAFGVSNYKFRTLLLVALNIITSFSSVPLQLASLLGFTLTAFGIAVLMWVLGNYLVLGYSVPGFPFLASIVAIFSGAQMFALGIIGEYLARMHFSALGRPTYTVRSRTESEERVR